MEKNIFIFDENKCVGCHACIVACINENGFQTPERWRKVHSSQDHHFPSIPLYHLSIACNHCDDAPCLKNCPASAYSRDPETGAVIHEAKKCIGCKYCTWACPYDAPKYNPSQGVIEKCTFCNSRIEDSLKPACANLCPTGALDFNKEKFSREESSKSSPVPVDIGSNIKIKKLRRKQSPEMDHKLFDGQYPLISDEKEFKKITAAKEWPLLIFTLLSSLLVALYASEATKGFSILHKGVYMSVAVLAAVLSMLHLGKKIRAWRSIINTKGSWLSREILSFSAFFGVVFFDFFIYDLPLVIGISIGTIFLISIDMLYSLAKWEWKLKIHSSQTTLIALSYLFIFMQLDWYFLASILVLRTGLYIYRKSKMVHFGLWRSIIRIFCMLSGLSMYIFTISIWDALILITIGEIVDRIEFYNELNVPDPKKEMI